jgi:hypothetical protein
MTTALKIEWVDYDGDVSEDPATIYWEADDGDGQWVSLLGIPDTTSGYVITKTWEKLSSLPRMTYRDLGDNWISLTRPNAGDLAAVLTATLLKNSENLIDFFSGRGAR